MGINLVGVISLFDHVNAFFFVPKLYCDNFVFRLHYLITAPLLFLCCVIVSVGQYFGNPISCLVKGKNVPEEVMNTYCWIHHTFVLPKNISMDIGSEAAHPGVGTYKETDEVVKNWYYLWVPYVLVAQGFLFLLPMKLWKVFQSHWLEDIIQKDLVLNSEDKYVAFPKIVNVHSDDIKEKLTKMKNHFLGTAPLSEKKWYLYKFAFCELLNLINVLVQLILLDFYFGHVFSTYGSEILSMMELDPDQRHDALDLVFPKVGKCNFHKYGPSGTIMRVDSLCVLPLNIINEKFYILIWIWFTFLAAVSSMNIVWRAATITSRKVREQYLRTLSLRRCKQKDLEIITENISKDDWFMMCEICKHIDETLYMELVSKLAENLNKVKRFDETGHYKNTPV